MLAPPRPDAVQIPPASVEAVLHFFLSCVGVSNTGAPGQSGIIACLLEFTAREGLEWHPAVGLAYRTIEAIIDIINGAAASLFRDLNGQGVLAQRLATALEGIQEEVPEETAGNSPEALVQCWDSRLSLTLQRGRVGSILRCVLAGLRAEASRGPGVLRGPLTPMVRKLLSQPAAVGAGAFAGASSIVAHLIGEDPSCVGTLIENGVIPAFLDAISSVPTLLRSSEVFQVVASVLGAVHLHDAGEKEVGKRSPHPFQVMVKLLTDPAAFRTLSGSAELHSSLGGALDEVAQNRPGMRATIVGFVIAGLDELLERARNYPDWSPSSGSTIGVVQDPTEQYADRLSAFGRFLETLLAQTEVATEFAKQGGASRVLDALTMPCLPPLFTQLAPGHSLVLVFRALAQGGHLVEDSSGEAGASAQPRLVGLNKLLEELQKSKFDKKLSDMSAQDATKFVHVLSSIGTVLSLYATAHRDIVSLSAVQPSVVSAASFALTGMTPAILWLFRQCSELGPPPSDPYADGGATRDTSTDFATLARDAYKKTCMDAVSEEGAYPKPVTDELAWRTLFSVRHFLVGMIARQLSLPARRPNRLFVAPPALAPAARSAANALAHLSTELVSAFVEGAENVAAHSDTEVLQRLRYLSETFELLFRAHVDEKHHHVRLLCVDRLHKAGFYGKPLDIAARYILAVAHRVAEAEKLHSSQAPQEGEPSNAMLEPMQKCLQGLAQYLDRLTSFKWIRSAPPPPTASSADRAAEAPEAPAQVIRAAPAEAEVAATAAPEAGATPAAATADATPSPPAQQGSAPTPTVSDEIDPWQLWASIAAGAVRTLLPFWQEQKAAVVRTYPAKAAVSIVQAFLNSLDDTDGRVLPDSGATGRQAATGSSGAQALSERAVQALVDMGFPRRRVEVALWNTGSSSIEFAMEWLINHPEPEQGEAQGVAEATAAAGGADGQRSDEGAGTADAVAAKLGEALAELRGSLLPRLSFIGAHVGSGKALVELATQLAHRAVPLKDFGAEVGAEIETGSASEKADAKRGANARALFEEMLVELRRISEAYPSSHRIWANSSDADLDEKETVHCGTCFAFGVCAQLLHHRPLVGHLVEKEPLGRMGELVDLTLSLVQRVLVQREAAFPTSWSGAFAEGYTFVFGNMALPTAKKTAAPAGETDDATAALAKPPAWFDAAFVTLHQATENMFLMPLPGSLAEMLQPTPPQLSAELQSRLVRLALDVLSLYSKAEGDTVQAVLYLLRELCAVPANAGLVLTYGRSGLLLEAGGRVVPVDGSGLLLLLRLPRLARFPGLLRLVSEICSQLLEDDAYHAQQIEEQILKLFAGSEAIELRQLFDKFWHPRQLWLRTCPQLFEDVLKGLCKARSLAKEGETPRVELVLAAEGERKHHRPPKSDSTNAQVVLQTMLDHLLWAIALERAHEKFAKTDAAVDASKAGTADAPGKKDQPSTSSRPSSAIAASPGSSGSTAAASKTKQDASSSPVYLNPLALPSDSALYVLQNIVSCFPHCATLFARSTHSAAKDALTEEASVRRGLWAPMIERPLELPATGTFLSGPPKALPACASSKSPLAFLLRKVLATNFFATEPSQATIATLQKVAHVLAAFATKHQETRSKVLHESVSLLKQLASHVEAGGSHLSSPRPGSAPRKTSGASDMASDTGEPSADEPGQWPSPGAFAAGVGALCELLLGAVRPLSAPITPAQGSGGGSSDRAGAQPTPAASGETPGAAAAAAPTPSAGTTGTPITPAQQPAASTGALSLAEARTLRSVLCRLLAAVNLYHTDATAAANHLVRCLELLSRPEFMDALSGIKSGSGGIGSTVAALRDGGSGAQGSAADAPMSSAVAGSSAPSEDVEMASVTEVLADVANVVGVERPDGLQPMGADFDEDDSIRTPSEGGGDFEGGRAGEYAARAGLDAGAVG
jgi:hypothetical protein